MNRNERKFKADINLKFEFEGDLTESEADGFLWFLEDNLKDAYKTWWRNHCCALRAKKDEWTVTMDKA